MEEIPLLYYEKELQNMSLCVDLAFGFQIVLILQCRLIFCAYYVCVCTYIYECMCMSVCTDQEWSYVSGK